VTGLLSLPQAASSKVRNIIQHVATGRNENDFMSDPLVEKYSLVYWNAALCIFRSQSVKSVAMKLLRSLIAWYGLDVMQSVSKHGLCLDQKVWRGEPDNGCADLLLKSDR
jgi:hypothetical protein